MIATITHELKNPLTSIARPRRAPRRTRAVVPGERGGDRAQRSRLQTLVEDMLLLTKVKRPAPAVRAGAGRPRARSSRRSCELMTIQAEPARQTIDTSGSSRGVLA